MSDHESGAVLRIRMGRPVLRRLYLTSNGKRTKVYGATDGVGREAFKR